MKRWVFETNDEVSEFDVEETLYNASWQANMSNTGVSEVKETWESANGKRRMTTKQRDALWRLCGNYNVDFSELDYFIDSKTGFAEGWVGGHQTVEHPTTKQPVPKTIYVGVSPEGEINS